MTFSSISVIPSEYKPANNKHDLTCALGTGKEYLIELRKIVDGQMLENEPMSKHTTYGIGGPAKVFIKPKDRRDLAKILKFSN